jgi:hypothetical protein
LGYDPMGGNRFSRTNGFVCSKIMRKEARR